MRNVGTGAQAVTGLGLAPVALILFGSNRTDTAYGDGLVDVFGLTDGAFSVSLTTVSDDAAGTTEVQRSLQEGRIYHTVSSAGTLTARASLTSLDADGFTIDWDVNDGEASVINYVAFGGDGVTAKAGVFDSATSDGDQSVTGLGLTPSAVLFWAAWTTATSQTSDFLSFPNMSWMAPAADGSGLTGGGCAISCEAGAAAANTSRYLRSDVAILGLRSGISGAPGTEYFAADAASLDADGFTVTWAPSNPTPVGVYYLALTGIDAVCGTLTQPTSPGSQAVTLPETFTPSGLLTLSAGDISHSPEVPQSEARFSLGASDGTQERGLWVGDVDAADPTESARRTSTSAILLATPAATGASSTTDAEATVTAWAAGSVTLTWATADATPRVALFLAFGASDEPPPEPEAVSDALPGMLPLIALPQDDLTRPGALSMTNEDASFPATNAATDDPARVAKSTTTTTTFTLTTPSASVVAVALIQTNATTASINGVDIPTVGLDLEGQRIHPWLYFPTPLGPTTTWEIELSRPSGIVFLGRLVVLTAIYPLNVKYGWAVGRVRGADDEIPTRRGSINYVGGDIRTKWGEGVVDLIEDEALLSALDLGCAGKFRPTLLIPDEHANEAWFVRQTTPYARSVTNLDVRVTHLRFEEVSSGPVTPR